MNNSRHTLSFRFTLLLLVLPASPLLLGMQGGNASAQAPADATALPQGIEATGDTVEVRALTGWADTNRNNDPGQAEQVARRALALARDLGDQRGIGKSSTILGHLAFRASDLNQAEESYTDAQEAFEQLGDERALIDVQINLGNVEKDRGALREALTYYFDALEGFERLDDAEGQARVLNNIGFTHRGQGNLEEALTYYERAVAFAETVDDPKLHVDLLNNVANVHSSQGSYESAEAHLRQALAIAVEEDSKLYTAMTSNNLGVVFNRQGRHERALPYLQTAERLATELGHVSGLFAVYDELGKTYMGLGQYGRALHYANEGLSLALEGELVSGQMEAHLTLSQVYEAAGNHEQALNHYRQYASVEDSVFNAEKTEIISEMQTRYETEEKQRAIERFEQENRIQALQLILLLGGIIVALLIAGLFYYRYRLKQKANRLLEELDTAKSRFFANISHEFRTPLTVILGGLQDALAGRFGKTTGKLTEQHQAMLRNTRQLQGLIEEVLDLNRLESGKLELHPAPGDLVRSLRRIVEADAPLAERNDIELTFEPNAETCPRLYDQEKLEKIVGNLLSNALKFTPEGGSVRVSLNCGNETEISVADDGPGIPMEEQANVFERFAQLEEGAQHGGTGIGLALAKELAELHGGTITLESEPGIGSTFTVRLPLEKATLKNVQGNTPRPFGTPPSRGALRSQSAPLRGLPAKWGGGVEPSENGSDLSRRPAAAKPSEAGSETKPETEPDRTTVLVIEDNDDVRAYVRRSLEASYRVLEAVDGEEGLEQAREALPDLIVSDVRMPRMDGYVLSEALKKDPMTDCIPVILLTARAATQDEVHGLVTGADDYVTKPFEAEVLRARVDGLIASRRRLRERFREGAAAPEEQEDTPRSPLEARLRAIVEAHLADPDFNPEALAEEAALSYKQLYRRLRDELGATPSQFIRRVRVEVAERLLTEKSGTISEVAYAVGFNSLSYFNRNFRERFGMAPSAYVDAET